MKNLNIQIVTITLLLFSLKSIQAQQNVGIGTTTPDVSAALDITATDKGMLIPRMNEVQRNLIVSPATGLLVYLHYGTHFRYSDKSALADKRIFDESALSKILVNAIQEQQTMIDELKKENELLRAQMDSVSQLISEIKEMKNNLASSKMED